MGKVSSKLIKHSGNVLLLVIIIYWDGAIAEGC